MATEFMEAKEVVKIAKPADLIEIELKSYHHWGIYVGGGDIVHFGYGSAAQDKSLVKRENLRKVAGPHLCRVNNRLDDKCPPRKTDLVMRDALQMVDQKVPYSVVSCNSELFVIWLRYNIKDSRQVDDEIFKALVAGTIQHFSAALGVAASLGGHKKKSVKTKKKQQQ